ncbi:hypothetical protein OAW18_05755 [Alphaproteobacteria bacterium]|nr:hypothetical protein [Alphaproteobacteria bacterium]
MLEYRQKKKQLIILDCIPKNFDINRLKGEHSDLLAITGEVVVHLSCNGYEFLTLNKIYSSADYRKDTDIFMKRMNYFLESCDFIWNLRCGFEYPFSGNEHCFSTWFTDLLFINNFCLRIQKSYEYITILTDQKISEISFSDLDIDDFVSNKTNFIAFSREKTYSNYLSLIRHLLDAEVLRVDNQIDRHFFEYLPDKLLLKSRQFIKKAHNWFNFSAARVNVNSKVEIHIVQGQFEVSLLSPNLAKKVFLDRDSFFKRRKQFNFECNEEEISKLRQLVRRELGLSFEFLNRYIQHVLYWYAVTVFPLIESFYVEYDKILERDVPRYMIFGIGVVDVLDSAAASLANRRCIEALVFQHGGNCLFGWNPFQESLEFDRRVQTTLMAQSKIECSGLSNGSTNVQCVGSIRSYNYWKKGSMRRPKSGLYVLGPDCNLAFRFLLNNYSIEKKYRQLKSLVKLVANSKIEFCIKAHPADSSLSQIAIKKVIAEVGLGRTWLSSKRKLADLADNYGLFIVDFLQSQIAGELLVLDVPVILIDFEFDIYPIPLRIKDDIARRCYVAKSESDLRYFLWLFENDNLPSKLDAKFLAGYYFDPKANSPVEKIKDFLQVF